MLQVLSVIKEVTCDSPHVFIFLPKFRLLPPVAITSGLAVKASLNVDIVQFVQLAVKDEGR